MLVEETVRKGIVLNIRESWYNPKRKPAALSLRWRHVLIKRCFQNTFRIGAAKYVVAGPPPRTERTLSPASSRHSQSWASHVWACFLRVQPLDEFNIHKAKRGRVRAAVVCFHRQAQRSSVWDDCVG